MGILLVFIASTELLEREGLTEDIFTLSNDLNEKQIGNQIWLKAGAKKSLEREHSALWRLVNQLREKVYHGKVDWYNYYF